MEVNISYQSQKKVIPITKIKQSVTKVVEYLNSKMGKTVVELNIVFLSRNEIKKLNKKFLNKNSSTDVLCFKYDDYSADIVISVDDVISQSKKFSTTPKEELLFVLIHGILHFYGMDDNTPLKQKQMLNYGRQLIKKLKLYE